ncbi:LytTR family transcriptional regulator, partial [Lactiplantibacillus plantarum]
LKNDHVTYDSFGVHTFKKDLTATVSMRTILAQIKRDHATKTARHVVTDQLGIRIDYDANASSVGTHYQGAVTEDYYGRQVPKPAHTTVTLAQASASQHELGAAYQQLYQRRERRKLGSTVCLGHW